MISSRRLLPIGSLAGLLLLFVIPLPYELDVPALRLALFLFGLLAWALAFRAGLEVVDKDCVVIRQDMLGNNRPFRAKETYLFFPGYHSVEATLPNYPIKCEFKIGGIDTRTPGLQRIDEIKVRVIYRIVDPLASFTRGAYFRERIKELETTRRLTRGDASLWKQLMNELVIGVVDDAIRTGVWHWADTLLREPRLNLSVPFPLPPNTSFDPYALSLNRDNLAQDILDEVQYQASQWGVEVDRLVFENFVIDPEIIKRKTRNLDRELDDARHQATLEAAAIEIKGVAEAEVRARTVARVIEVLLNQKGLNLTNDVLYNVVRAAMYSDGEMIWKGVVEKSGPGGPGAAPGTAKIA